MSLYASLTLTVGTVMTPPWAGLPAAPETAAAEGSMRADVVSDVCPEAPPGIAPYVDLIFSWVKYGVLAIIVVTAIVSIAAMVVAKFARMGQLAQAGAGGLMTAILAAILYVTIYGIVTAITGSGC
ncbi:hypothetical protein [Nocardioides zeae]